MTTSTVTYNLAGLVRHQGLPVAGIQVLVYDSHQGLAGNLSTLSECLINRGRTGNRGEFTFGVTPGNYRIEIVPGPNTRFLMTSLPITVGNTNATCNVSLSTGSILSGKVRTRSGAPLFGGEVIALGIEPTSYRSWALVGADGRYTMILPRGKFHFAYRSRLDEPLEDSEAVVQFERAYRSSSFVSSEIAVVAVDGDDTFDLYLPDFVTLEGEVTDVFGHPVGRAKVTVTPAQPDDRVLANELALSASCETDKSGHFTVKAQPGVYNISVEPEEAALLFGLQDNEVQITENSTRKFQLTEGFRLRGQVSHDDEPLSHCLVRILGLEKKFEHIAKTDSKGQFSVGVPSGSYKLIVLAHPKDAPTVTINGADYHGLAPWAKVVTVGGDTFVAVKLTQGTALHGKILDDSGQGRPGVRVSVFADTGKGPDRDRIDRALSSGITDGEGNYCIFLSPGTYWLAVHTDVSNAARVEMGSQPVTLDITWHGWCQLKFEVTGQDGLRIPRCRVSYAPYGSGTGDTAFDDGTIDDNSTLPRGYLITSEDGFCQVTIPSGVYSVKFTPPPDSSYHQKVIRQLSVNADTVRAVRLPLKSEMADD